MAYEKIIAGSAGAMCVWEQRESPPREVCEKSSRIGNGGSVSIEGHGVSLLTREACGKSKMGDSGVVHVGEQGVSLSTREAYE